VSSSGFFAGTPGTGQKTPKVIDFSEFDGGGSDSRIFFLELIPQSRKDSMTPAGASIPGQSFALMKTHRSFITLAIASLAFMFNLGAAEPGAKPICPVDGKPAEAKFSTEYEGRTYTFCGAACRDKFQEDRANSLYQKLGGQAAINAAVDLFYTKVLADGRVNHFFEDVNMKRQHNQQKAFLAAALGGPIPWAGKDMRTAHASLDLNDSHFDAIAEHLQATLVELKVPKELIEQVMGIVASTRTDVLNRPKAAAAKP